MKMYRKPRSLIHNFKRVCQLTPITVTANAGKTYGGLSFRLSNLNNYQEFTSLFDSYRILAVKVKFIPDISSVPIITGNNNLGMGSLHTAIDHNDTTPPPNLSDILEYDTYKAKPIWRTWSRYFRVNTLGQKTVANTQYNTDINWKKWLPTSLVTDGVDDDYYGLKWVADEYLVPATEPDTLLINMYATFYFQCKSLV